MPTLNKNRRIWVYGSNTLIVSVLFLGLIAFVALIAERHPWRVDLTESGSFTLSDQTRNVIKSLDKPVQIKAFFATASPEQVKAKDLLDSYQYLNKNISYELVDPDREPEVARRYEVRSYGTLVLEGYGKTQSIQTADEENLTNALLKLTSSSEKKIYFLKGHGEHSLESAEKDGYSSVKSALGKDNYAVQDLNLMQQDRVPEDAAAVVVAGAQKPLFAQEIASLKTYLDGGGKLMVFVDPYQDAGLREFLQGYGVELKDDIVIDKLSRLFGGSYLTPVVMQYGAHKITDGFDVATFYPEARSVRPSEKAPAGVHVQVLASTSPNAWAETDLETLKKGEASFDEKSDMPGPVPLVVLADVDAKADKPQDAAAKNPADQPAGKGKGELLVVGDSDFVSNTYFGLSGNGDLFLNMANFMAAQENLITIAPRQKAGHPILLTQSQAQALAWTLLVFVPLLVLLSGLMVYRVRRSQR